MKKPQASDRPAFAIGRAERVSDAIRRVVAQDLRWIEAALQDADLERVHPARRRLKRCRALLRVAGRRVPAAVRDALRETAGALGRIRDRQVREAITAGPGVGDAPDGADHPAAPPGADDSATFETSAQALGKVRAALAGLDFAGGRRMMNRALEEAMIRQRKAYRRARATEDTEDFHDWRKTLQNLASLCQFGGTRLQRSARLGRHAGKAIALLGEDHDLALLETPPGAPSASGLAVRRALLQREAIRKGRALERLAAPGLRRRDG
jgi:hypothetical protein